MNTLLPKNNYEYALTFIKELFAFPLEEMQQMVTDFCAQMQQGLAGEESYLKMIPTYIPLPTGDETGYALAIDMGGTNLRVMFVKLQGKAGKPQVILASKRELAKSEMNKDAEVLFSIVADEVNKLLIALDSQNIEKTENHLDIGFTFSYPVQMINKNTGTIVNLAKELTASGLIGENPFHLLFKELEHIKHQSQLFPVSTLRPGALLNDTVTELIYGAYLKAIESSPYTCDIGGIIGTGHNFAVVLNTKDIPKFNDSEYKEKQMIVNMESGNFDADSLPVNIFDLRVDQNSHNTSCQSLEKIIAGNYLGRIVVEVLKELVASSNLFNGNMTLYAKLEAYKCQHMSALEECYKNDPEQAKHILAGIGLEPINDTDLAIIYEATAIIAKRATRVASTALAAILQFIDPELKNKHTIAIDGSVFGKYPGYKTSMEEALQELLGDKADLVKLEYISDGSGIGAAIAAKA